MELKHLLEMPKKEDTVVRIPHYTDEQRLWLRSRGESGGYAWLFVQVGRSYFLFDWREAQQVGTELTRIDWLMNKTRWTGRVDWKEWLSKVVYL